MNGDTIILIDIIFFYIEFQDGNIIFQFHFILLNLIN